MKKITSNLCAYVFSITFVIVLLITSIDINCFDKDFYINEFEKINNAEVIGTSESELLDFCFVVLDYVQDNRDDMITYAEINGEYREVFNEREKLHMVDVKDLYLDAIDLRNLFLILMFVSGFIYLLLNKQDYKIFTKAYQNTLLAFLAVIASILFYALIDFTNFWIGFHHLFFDNDLWLLDPRTSIMINMVPQQFFNDLVMRIIAMFVIPLIIMAGITVVYNKRKKI